MGIEPDPLPVLSPAGRALPRAVSWLAAQHPTEHLLSTALGSGQLAQQLPQPFLRCMNMQEFLLTQCVCVPEPDLISEPLRHGLRLTLKKPHRDPPVSTHRQKCVSCLQARILAFPSPLSNSALPLLLYPLV